MSVRSKRCWGGSSASRSVQVLGGAAALVALSVLLAALPARAETARDGSWTDRRTPAETRRPEASPAPLPDGVQEDGVERPSAPGPTRRREADPSPDDTPETRPDAPPADRAPDRDPNRGPDALDASDPVRLEDPRRDVVIVFNHGTNRPQVRHSCDRTGDLPGLMVGLARKTGWRLHYLCSTAIDGGDQGSYTYKRAAEIERVVDAYRALGLPAARLFLAGHSAGAWSSLIAARRFGAKFNAVIAFAPAFAGPRHEVRQYPWWRNQIRPRQVADILKAERLRALVFAFPDDDFNRPRELEFLKKLTGVTLVPFDRCMRGHGTTYTRCFSEAAAARVERYIRARLADQP